jgi:hypothetical protein
MMTLTSHQDSSVRFSRAFAFCALGVLFLSASTTACGSGDDDGDGGGDVVVTDENNYTATARLMIPVVQTAPSANVQFCLDSLTKNLQCHDLSPLGDIDNVTFLQIQGMSKEVVTSKLEDDTFATSDVKTYMEYRTDHATSCVNLGDMISLGDPGPPIELNTHYVEDPNMTYLVLFTQGTSPGVGAQSMLFLEPTSASSGTAAPALSGCDMLQFVPDLQSSTPLSIKKTGPWEIDWSGLTRDSQGNPVKFNRVDRLVIGFYENLTLADLEAQIFDLETLPKDLYEISLTGQREANLADAVHTVTGQSFSGFDQATEGVWIFGLLCGGCQTPAPIVLSTIQPID